MGQCISKGAATACASRNRDSLSVSSSIGGDEETTLQSIAASTSQEPEHKEKSHIATIKKVQGEFRPILLKSRLQDSRLELPSTSSTQGRRVQFFISPTKSDMKRGDIKISTKKISPEVSLESVIESHRIRLSSPKNSKKYPKKKDIISKSVTFLEPEIENTNICPPPKPLRIFSHRQQSSSSSSSFRKPLLPLNIKSTQSVPSTTTTSLVTSAEFTDNSRINRIVSKLPSFKFSRKSNDNSIIKNAQRNEANSNPPHAHAASVIVIAATDSTTHNLTATNQQTTTPNGNDIPILLDFATPTTNNKMGVNFSDETTGGKSSNVIRRTYNLQQQQQHLLELERNNLTLDNININNNQTGSGTSFKTIHQGSNNASSLTTKLRNNNDNNNLNDLTNIYVEHADDKVPSTTTAIKSAEKIIEENRLRRNLFFGSPEITQTNSNINHPCLIESNNINIIRNNNFIENMNGYPKNSIFKNSHDTKQKLHHQQESTIPVPKLYSIHHVAHPPTSNNTVKGGSTTTLDKNHATTTSTSKLPTFAGGYNNNSRLPSTTTKTSINSTATQPPSNLFNNRIQNILPGNVKTSQFVGSRPELSHDPKVTQWISANDFFKQNPTSKCPSGVGGIKSQQHVDPRRETLPSRFGYGYGQHTHQVSTAANRKKIGDSQLNEVIDRRASTYASSSNVAGRRIPIPSSSTSGVRKPVESKPFYEIGLYQNRQRNVQPSGAAGSSIRSSSTFGSGGIFQGVHTGRVKQAATNFEKKINESATSQSSGDSGHNTSSSSVPQQSSNTSLLRTNTWVKSSPSIYTDANSSENPDNSRVNDITITQKMTDSGSAGADDDRNTNRQPHSSVPTPSSSKQVRKSFSQSGGGSPWQPRPARLSLGGLPPSRKAEEENFTDNSSGRSDTVLEGKINKDLILPHEEEEQVRTNNCNYPITRDGSTSSSVISSEEPTSLSSSHVPGGADHDKAISEFGEFYDDEIEDQPDLTLTFKDSSLILSPSSSGESLVSCDLMLDYKDRRRRRRRRRVGREYICEIFRKRNERGEMFLVDDLENDPVKFRTYFRMSKETFDKLLSKVSPRIQHGRNHAFPISAKHRLAFTLRYICGGGTIQYLAFSYRISESSGYLILRETLRAIADVLGPEYLPTPTTNDWKNVAEGFWNKWQFPNCFGACDGKHIRTKCPPKSGSQHYNYKNFFSNILLAVVDAEYRFVVVDIGAQGSLSDSGILSKNEFGNSLLNGTLDVPRPQNLPDSDVTLPYVIVGDSGFPLKKHIMRPFASTTTSVPEKVFNYRLSRARRVSENAFGLLAARFRIFLTTIDATSLTDDIVLAAVVLHNFIMKEDKENQLTPDREINGELIPGNWRDEVEEGDEFADMQHEQYANTDKDAEKIREKFSQYFMSHAGSLPWQIKHVTRTSV